jgi:hypothetical protein
MTNPGDVLRRAHEQVETRSWGRRHWRLLTVVGIAVVAVVVVGTIQALNGSTPAPHPLGVATTEHAFAAAGLPVAPAPGAILTVGGSSDPSAILAYSGGGDLTTNPHAVFVVLYPNVKDAAEASAFNPTLLGQTLKLARARNVLVEWRGPENPSVKAAIKRLS